MKTTVWKALIGGMILAGLAMAADEEPGRGVARVSLLNGDVSVRRGDSGDWVAAAVNAPLVVEDTLATGVNSRAEVQFDWANLIRVAPESEIRLAELDNLRYNVQVARGLVTFRVERDSDADVEISTPSVSVRPMKKGSYRIYVRDDGETEITVRSGEAEVFTPTGSQRLKSGRTLLARGSAADPEYRIVAAADRDGWDRWNEDRDRYYGRANAYRYVNRSVYGVEDLDGYGSWIYVAPYGYVWTPRVAVGWSPYYYGRWSWIDWYGWSWVSYDPWGWAPYHYGRWFYHGSRWCWWPGGLYTRHYWSPGLVAFVGWGGWGGFHAGLGIGHIGWIPLAPYEPYYPWYGHGYYRGYRNSTYIDNSIRIVNNTNIVNIYRNARVHNGIVAVNSNEFGRGGAIHSRVNRGEIGRVDLVRGQLPVAPDRSSQNLSERRGSVTPPRTTTNTQFYSRRPAPPVERVPFEQQQRGMEQVARRAFENAPAARPAVTGGAGSGAAPATRAGAPAVRELPSSQGERGGAPAARTEAPARGQGTVERTTPAALGATGGWRRVGEPPRTGVQDSGSTGEWRRFGSTPARVNPGTGDNQRQPARPSVESRTAEPRGAESPRVTPAPRTTQREDSSNWRRFEPTRESGAGGRTTAPETRGVERSAPTPRTSEPRAQPQATPERRSEPLRISPPIVRERPAPSRTESSAPYSQGGGGSVRSMPSYGGGSGRQAPSYGGGGAARPAPSYGGGSVRSAPNYGGGGAVRSAPSYGGGAVRSAPSYGGGGAGRTAPSGGGGGGSARPGGGGRVSPGSRSR